MDTSPIVDARGRPIVRPAGVPATCPQCGAGRDQRMLSAGFGTPHDVCLVCGHEFSLEETRPS